MCGWLRNGGRTRAELDGRLCSDREAFQAGVELGSSDPEGALRLVFCWRAWIPGRRGWHAFRCRGAGPTSNQAPQIGQPKSPSRVLVVLSFSALPIL